MEQADDQAREIAELRDRLSRLSQASLRINESLDFDTVLQGVLDSACSLTGARYGVITLLDDSGRIEDFVTSGLTAEERQTICGAARRAEALRAPQQDCRAAETAGTSTATPGRWAFPSSARRWRSAPF